MNACLLAAVILSTAGFPLLANAQVATTLTLEAPRTVLKGDLVAIRAKVTFPGACPSTPAPTGGNVTFHGSSGDTTYPLWGGILRTCSSGFYTDATDFSLNTNTPGDYTFTADYSGTAGFAPAAATPVTVTVLPYLSGSVGSGIAKMNVAIGLNGFYCGAHEASFDSSAPGNAPDELKRALGQANYSFRDCTFNCEILCWPGAPRFPLQTVTVEMPQPLPAGASVWIHATGSGMTTPVWRHVPATIDGATATFTLTGNDGDRTLEGTLLILPDSAASRTDLQDLWWGGSAQNGWGFDLSQQGDRLFGALYAYRTDGSPVWLVMPGGTWDAAHSVFSGTLYGATGSSYLQYDASRLNVAPTGSAKLAFANNGQATFDYTIGSESGRKTLLRQPIGSTAQPVQGPYAGLWWGGSAQNGWGISIAHQDDTLFAVWYTYDANGSPTWYVMSGGYWVTSTHSPDHSAYNGTLYRTSGSPFLGGTYDPSKLVVTAVGNIGFEFFGTDVAYMGYTVDGHTGHQTLYRQPF